MANLKPALREPKRDCILYRNSRISAHGGCGGLNELYCVTELKQCPFYKSKDEYRADGSPLKGINGVL